MEGGDVSVGLGNQWLKNTWRKYHQKIIIDGWKVSIILKLFKANGSTLKQSIY